MPVRESADNRPLEAVLAAGPAPGPGARRWWLGQAGFLVQAGGSTILVDPYLSDYLARKYAGKLHPHIRMMPSPLPPAQAPLPNAQQLGGPDHRVEDDVILAEEVD